METIILVVTVLLIFCSYSNILYKKWNYHNVFLKDNYLKLLTFELFLLCFNYIDNNWLNYMYTLSVSSSRCFIFNLLTIFFIVHLMQKWLGHFAWLGSLS